MRIEPTLLFSLIAAAVASTDNNCERICKNAEGCSSSYCKDWNTPAVCQGVLTRFDGTGRCFAGLADCTGAPTMCDASVDIGKTTTTTTTTTTAPTTTTTKPTAPGLQVVSECPAAPANPEDRRADKKSLTMMHWNVEWLFMPEVSYEGSGRPLPGVTCPGDCPWKTKEAAEKHLQEVAELMAGVQEADIVTFNEIQDCTLLKELNSRIPQDYTPYFTWSGDTDKSMNVGMLTRIDPVKDFVWIDDSAIHPLPDSECGFTGESEPYVSSRNYMTTFEIEGLDKPLTVIGAHLSSRPTDKYRCSRREAEALSISMKARAALAQGHHVIIAGDLNDYDGDNLDKDGSIPNSRVLNQLKLDGMMETATSLVPREERYTYSHTKYGNNNLDHFLIDADLWQKVESVSIKHAHEKHPDHFPIIVKFDLKA